MAKLKERFTAEDLFYNETLTDLISAQTEFCLGAAHSLNFSLIDVIPIDEDMEEARFRLAEEVYEQMSQPNLKLTKRLKKRDIVLAPKCDNQLNQYHRAVVMSVDGDRCQVYWIDEGGTESLTLSKLKPVNDAIMKFPRLSYSVILQDVTPANDYILTKDFENFMATLKKQKTPLVLSLGEKCNVSGRLVSTNQVFVTFSPPNTTKCKSSLKEEIDLLAKWDWERLSKLSGSDNEVSSRGRHKGTFLNQKWMYPLDLGPVGSKFAAKVARILDDDGNETVSNLRLLSIDTHLYKNYWKVLHNQLDKYTSNIQSSDFYPAIGEPVLVRVENKPEYQKITEMLGIWARAVRLLKDYLYFYDYDEMLKINEIATEDLYLRPLNLEFCLKVPCLCVTVKPTDVGGKPLTVQQANVQFQKGNKYVFHIRQTKNGGKCLVQVET